MAVRDVFNDMRFRITIILMIALGGLTAIATGTVLVISASASIKNTLELTRQRAELTISAVERAVADHLQPGPDLIAGISGRVADGSLDLAESQRLTDVLGGTLASAPQLGGIVLWRKDDSGVSVYRDETGGIGVTENPEADVPQFSTFMSGLATAEDMVWAPPYHLNNETFITIGSRLAIRGEVVGSIATGISLEALSRFVGRLNQNGLTAFVLYGDDRVLAHPAMLDESREQLLSVEKPMLSVSEIDDAVLAGFAAAEQVKLRGWGDLDIRETGQRESGDLILSRTSSGYGAVPWRIGIHVPVEAVSEQIKRLIGSIVISIGMLVVSLAAALLLARRIARPMRAVAAAAGKIERLELDTIPPLKGSMIREIDDQAVSFNRMIQGLKWFQAYVPHQLVRRLMNVTGGPVTDAREAELTVMFADVVGFTPLSESMPPTRVAAMLNDHFEMLGACIEAEDGTLDKYIGDAVMAFWGAPEPIKDHAARACRTALAMARALEAKHDGAPGEKFRLKIALHSGPLIVGNIGGRTRMNYTVIGDTVNVCARIEALASGYIGDAAVTILVSGDVVQAAGAGFRFEPLGDVTVKGREQSVAIWRLVGEAGPAATRAEAAASASGIA